MKSKAMDWRAVDSLIKLRDDSDIRISRPRLKERASEHKMMQSFSGILLNDVRDAKLRPMMARGATKKTIENFKITTISRGSLDNIIVDKKPQYSLMKDDYIKMVDSTLKLSEVLGVLKNQSLRASGKSERVLVWLRIIDTVGEHCKPAHQSLRDASSHIRKMLFADGSSHKEITAYIKQKVMLGSLDSSSKEVPTFEVSGLLWQQAATLLYSLCKSLEDKNDIELKKYKYNEAIYTDEISSLKLQLSTIEDINVKIDQRLKTGYNEAQETIDNLKSEFMMVKQNHQTTVLALQEHIETHQLAYKTLILEHGQEFKEIDKKYNETLEKKITDLEMALENIDAITSTKNTAMSKYKDVMVKLNEASCMIRMLREENKELSKQVENYQKITGVFENTDLTPRPNLTEILQEMNLDIPTMAAIEENKFQTTEQRIRTMLGLLKIHGGLNKMISKKPKSVNILKR